MPALLQAAAAAAAAAAGRDRQDAGRRPASSPPAPAAAPVRSADADAVPENAASSPVGGACPPDDEAHRPREPPSRATGLAEAPSWSDIVKGAVDELRRSSGGRTDFGVDEICCQVQRVHGKWPFGVSGDSLRSMVFLVLGMQKALSRTGLPFASPHRPTPAQAQDMPVVSAVPVSFDEVRHPSSPPSKLAVPGLPVSPPSASEKFLLPGAVSPESPCSPVTTSSPGGGALNPPTPRRAATLADVVAAAAFLESQGCQGKRSYLSDGGSDKSDRGNWSPGPKRRKRSERAVPPESPFAAICGTMTLQTPSLTCSPSDAKLPKWRDLVYMALKRMYEENHNRQAFRLKDIADLTEIYWDRLRAGTPKPGNFRSSVAAVLAGTPSLFTTGVGAGHQGWWSLTEMKTLPPSSPGTPAAFHSPLGGGLLTPTSSAETFGSGEDEDEFFFRQGEYKHLRSDQAEQGDDSRGQQGEPRKKRRRNTARLTWKALLICVLRDLSAGRVPGRDGEFVQRLWIPAEEISAEAEKRWNERGRRAATSKYWRPTLRRTLVENPEFKCGSAGYGMNGMWALTEYLNGTPLPSPGGGKLAVPRVQEERHAEEESVESDDEAVVSSALRSMQSPDPSPNMKQENSFVMRLPSLHIGASDAITTARYHGLRDGGYAGQGDDGQEVFGPSDTSSGSDSDSESQSESDSDSESGDGGETEDANDHERRHPGVVYEYPARFARSPQEGNPYGAPQRAGRRDDPADGPEGFSDTESDWSPSSSSRESSPAADGAWSPRADRNGAAAAPRRPGKSKPGGQNAPKRAGGSPPAAAKIVRRLPAPGSTARGKASVAAVTTGVKRRNATWTTALISAFEALQKEHPDRACFHFTEVYHWVDTRWLELFPDRTKNETWQRTISGRLSDLPNFVRASVPYSGWWKVRGQADSFGDLKDLGPPFPSYTSGKPELRAAAPASPAKSGC